MGRRVTFDSSSIKHFPRHGVTVQRKPDRLYVMCRKFYLDARGVRREHRVYIGHVNDNVFYTTEESYKLRLSKQPQSGTQHLEFDPGITKLTLHQVHLMQQFYHHNPEYISKSPLTVLALAQCLQQLATNAEHPLWRQALPSATTTPRPSARPRKNAVPTAEDIFLEAQIDIFNFTSTAEFKSWLSLDPHAPVLTARLSVPRTAPIAVSPPRTEASVSEVQASEVPASEEQGAALAGTAPVAAPSGELTQMAQVGAKALAATPAELTLGLWFNRPQHHGAWVALSEHNPPCYMARYRIYDCDCNRWGVATENSMLRYCQQARQDFFLEQLSFDFEHYLHEHQLYLFQVEAQVRFFAPLTSGSEIVVSVVPLKVQRSCLLFYQEIRDRAGVLRFAHKSRHVLCEYQGLQVNLPPDIFALLAPQVPSTPPTEAF